MSIRAQFSNPSGVVGWLVGRLMALKNRERGAWVVDRLELSPGDRVLEIGFGPGVDLARVAARVPHGSVAGVDRSATMVAQARARLSSARADLREGDACALPFDDAVFDVVFASNSVQFWDDRTAAFREIARVLRPAGRVVVAIQPRNSGATDATSREWAERLVNELTTVGFVDVRSETKPMKPVAVVAAMGQTRTPRSSREERGDLADT
jgi:ubiquinone/menaquinone biosynthesis C-methylase UbiE